MGFQSRSALLLATVSAIVMAIFTEPVSADFDSYFKPVATAENPLTVDYSKYLEVWGDEVAAAALSANRGGRKLLQYGDSNRPSTCSNTPGPHWGFTGADATCPGCQWCYSWGCFQSSAIVRPYNQQCGRIRVNQIIYCARFPNRCGIQMS